MSKVIDVAISAQGLLNKTRSADFLAPLLIRIYLFPVFWMAGYNKLTGFEGTVGWFNSMGFPAPELMVVLAISAELAGAVLLLIGIAVRWATIPLMFTMLIAMSSVHLENGWFAISDSSVCMFNCEKYEEAQIRKDKAKEILKKHSNYSWITEKGSITILNNGIEFAATYFIMLLMLFFVGAGKYLSVDYWIKESINKH